MRFQRLAAATALLGAAVVVGLTLRDRPAEAKSVPGVVRAQTIELVDRRGRVRAQLKVETGGQVVFRLRDAAGRIRVKLGADEAGSGLVLMNETSEPGVHALATRAATSLALQRGEQRNVLTP
jgi:hypothetical protein